MATETITVTVPITFTPSSENVRNQVKNLLSQASVITEPVAATECTVTQITLSAEPLTEGVKSLESGINNLQIPKLDISSFVEEVKIAAPGELSFLAIVFDYPDPKTVPVRFGFQPPKGPVEIKLTDVVNQTVRGLADTLLRQTAALITPSEIKQVTHSEIKQAGEKRKHFCGKVYAGNDILKLIGKAPKDPALSIYFVNAYTIKQEDETKFEPAQFKVTVIVGWNKPTPK